MRLFNPCRARSRTGRRSSPCARPPLAASARSVDTTTRAAAFPSTRRVHERHACARREDGFELRASQKMEGSWRREKEQSACPSCLMGRTCGSRGRGRGRSRPIAPGTHASRDDREPICGIGPRCLVPAWGCPVRIVLRSSPCTEPDAYTVADASRTQGRVPRSSPGRHDERSRRDIFPRPSRGVRPGSGPSPWA